MRWDEMDTLLLAITKTYGKFREFLHRDLLTEETQKNLLDELTRHALALNEILRNAKEGKPT